MRESPDERGALWVEVAGGALDTAGDNNATGTFGSGSTRTGLPTASVFAQAVERSQVVWWAQWGAHLLDAEPVGARAVTDEDTGALVHEDSPHRALALDDHAGDTGPAREFVTNGGEHGRVGASSEQGQVE